MISELTENLENRGQMLFLEEEVKTQKENTLLRVTQVASGTLRTKPQVSKGLAHCLSSGKVDNISLHSIPFTVLPSLCS